MTGNEGGDVWGMTNANQGFVVHGESFPLGIGLLAF